MDKKILLIIAIAFVLRIIFLSHWLEDWDSVQFALALHHYSIILDQPHAPGYPLYELMGKFLSIFLNDDNRSLTLLSALLGSLAAVPLYLLTLLMFDKKIAVVSSVLFLLTPIEWTLSTVALTNVPGLFFLILFTYFLYKYSKNPKILPLVSLFGGFILGVRFTEFPVIFSLLVFILLKGKDVKLFIISLLAFIAGIMLWLIPLVIITTPEGFLNSYQTIAKYITYHDSVIGQESNLISTLKLRLRGFSYLFSIGYTNFFILISLSSLVILFFKKGFRQFNYQFLLIWLFSYLIPLIFYYNLEVTRYTLPLLPPLVILVCSIIFRITKSGYLYFFIGIIAIVLVYQSLDQLIRFSRTTPPSIAPVQYVTKNYNPKNISIIATFTYRQFQYYAPSHQVFYGDKIDDDAQLKEFVALDYLDIKSKIKKLDGYYVFSKQEFSGDKDIFNRLNNTKLYILKKNE